MDDGLDQAREAIERRLRELDSESQRLRDALSKLAGESPAAQADASQNGGPESTRRARRGERQAQFLAVLEQHPGAKLADIAKEMGVHPSQAHNLARRLHEAGRIRKRRGGGYAVKN